MIAKNLKSKGFHWLIMSMLVISLSLYSASTFPKSSAAQVGSPTVLVDPAQTIVTGATAGTLFNVSVSIANTTGFLGVQWDLSYNTSFLTCTGLTEVLYHNVTPPDHYDNIWSIKLTVNKTGGIASYAQTFQDSSAALDGGYAPINVTTANYAEGKETTAILTFNVTTAPPTNGVVESYLNLSRVVIGDVNGLPISVDVVNGAIVVYGPPETLTNSVMKDSVNYNVITVSNATVVPDSMVYKANWTISFNLTAAANGGTSAYVNMTIPLNFISLASATDHWNVTVNGTPVTPMVTADSMNTYLYFTTDLSTDVVQIMGTVPEFPLLMLIPLLMIVTLIAVELRRRRQI